MWGAPATHTGVVLLYHIEYSEGSVLCIRKRGRVLLNLIYTVLWEWILVNLSVPQCVKEICWLTSAEKSGVCLRLKLHRGEGDGETTTRLFLAQLWPTNPDEKKGRAEQQGGWGYSGNTHTRQPGHLFVGLLCHSKDVGVHVSHVLAAVGVDDVCAVDWKRLIGIDGHQDNSYSTGHKVCYKLFSSPFERRGRQVIERKPGSGTKIVLNSSEKENTKAELGWILKVKFIKYVNR